MKLIAVVMGAYNEESTIANLITSIPSSIDGASVEVIVASDGSTDRTAHVARAAGARVVELEVNRGQGAALRAGFEVALARRADVIVTMDADGQHDPRELADLCRPVLEGDADYVQGSRFLGRHDAAGTARARGIWLFTRLINLLGRVRITDCTNGYRAIRADVVRQMHLRESRFSAPEIIMEAARGGARMREVPVYIHRREAGASKKPRGLGYPLGFLRVIVQVWLRRLGLSRTRTSQLAPPPTER
jgi:glycosyltransferase involved in cell wall biosynthesis